ncbi:MAC/perforin domain-containing protein [Myroides odoratus]|uniref:MAC/perforin domain-containing protein n=1 Tax=Myroides odoratus TaxID=256 RepID=UPI0039AFD779
MKKKLFLTLLIALSILSCSSDDKTIVKETDYSGQIIAPRTAGDSKYDILGYGYKITEPLASTQAVGNFSIIDIEKLVNSEPANSIYFDNPFIGEITQRIFSGENFYKYVEEVISHTNFSGSVASNGIEKSAEQGMFSASVKTSQENQSKNSYSSAYSYATAEVIKKERRLFIDTDIEVLKKYLTPYFQEKVSKVNSNSNAYDLVKTFGTHVLLDITIGGDFKSEFKSLSIEESNYTNKKRNAEVGAKFTLYKIGVGASVGWGGESSEQEINRITNWASYIHSKGGTTNGLSLTVNSIGAITYSIGIGTWASSITDKTARLVDLNWDKTYPLYELITDPIKKELVKKAVNNYIYANTPEEIETKPLHRYWNGRHKMFYSTTIYGESRMTNDWKYEGVLGYIDANQKSTTKPLYRYWNERHKMFYFTATYGESRMTKDWKYEGILGYIYTTEIKGTVPLYRYWNERHKMFYLTTTYGESRMTNDWKYEGLLGYVYKSDLPCINIDDNPNAKPVPNIMNWE